MVVEELDQAEVEPREPFAAVVATGVGRGEASVRLARARREVAGGELAVREVAQHPIGLDAVAGSAAEVAGLPVAGDRAGRVAPFVEGGASIVQQTSDEIRVAQRPGDRETFVGKRECTGQVALTVPNPRQHRECIDGERIVVLRTTYRERLLAPGAGSLVVAVGEQPRECGKCTPACERSVTCVSSRSSSAVKASTPSIAYPLNSQNHQSAIQRRSPGSGSESVRLCASAARRLSCSSSSKSSNSA